MAARLYGLTEEGLDRLLASDPFRALGADRAGMAEELLRTALGGANRVPMRTARLRVEALIRALALEDGAGLREAVLDALVAR